MCPCRAVAGCAACFDMASTKPYEITYSIVLDVNVTSSFAALATHLSPYVTRGSIQLVKECGNAPVLRVLSTLKTRGLICFTVPCVASLHSEKNVDSFVLAFANSAAGGLVRPFELLFSPHLLSAYVRVCRPLASCMLDSYVVKTSLMFLNQSSKMSYDVPLTIFPVVARDPEGILVGTLALTQKTCHHVIRCLLYTSPSPRDTR